MRHLNNRLKVAIPAALILFYEIGAVVAAKPAAANPDEISYAGNQNAYAAVGADGLDTLSCKRDGSGGTFLGADGKVNRWTANPDGSIIVTLGSAPKVSEEFSADRRHVVMKLSAYKIPLDPAGDLTDMTPKRVSDEVATCFEVRNAVRIGYAF